ncbi:elongator complex protein 4 [Pancytospora philotis]|nr:elongator complex protein 4 [Pancytospora philotis]
MAGFTRSSGALAEHRGGTGIPMLDGLIRVVPGTVSAIYEDEFSFVHNAMLAIFTSHAADALGLPVSVLSTEEKLLHRYGKQAAAAPEGDAQDQRLTIAWRYASLSTGSDNFGWDLNSKLPLSADSVLSSLEEALDLLKSTTGRAVVLYSLFAPLYGRRTPDEMHRVLYEIRKYARLNRHIVFCSVPTFLLPATCSPFFDSIVGITSLLTMPNEKSSYNCILTLLKRSSPGTLDVRSLSSFKYGVKVTSKSFRVEKIDIPPEEEPAPQGGACGASF